MKAKEFDECEKELERLCVHYGIPEIKQPIIEFVSDLGDGDFVGLYTAMNDIWIFDGLSLEEALKTVRHEFGHFLLWYRDPKRKHTRKEETICKMMERTLLKFPHLKYTKQKSLLEITK